MTVLRVTSAAATCGAGEEKDEHHPSPPPSSSPTIPPRPGLLSGKAANIITRGGLGHLTESPPPTPHSDTIAQALDLYASQFHANQPRSLSGVALRSFILGLLASTGLILCLFLAFLRISIWRAPFFISVLCIFHFLEYWTTARSNPSAAAISSFLITSNGAAYNTAHSCSLIEMTIIYFFFPRPFFPKPIRILLLLIGMIFIIVGQATRAIAILTAGPSFSHLVAHHKRKTHVLITHGIYSVLRHPSYFGFFWWGIGTQLVCGNLICLLCYALVLYWFFRIRIHGEELLLVKFFGKEYRDYAERTIVAIPGLS